MNVSTGNPSISLPNLNSPQVRTLLDLHSSYIPELLTPVGLEYAYGQLCANTQGIPPEIQSPAHWNGRSVPAPPLMLSRSSILLPPSYDCNLTFKNRASYI